MSHLGSPDTIRFDCDARCGRIKRDLHVLAADLHRIDKDMKAPLTRANKRGVLRPHPQRIRTSKSFNRIDVNWCCFKAALPQRTLHQVHGRRSDESRHKQASRLVMDFLGRSKLLDHIAVHDRDFVRHLAPSSSNPQPVTPEEFHVCSWSYQSSIG